MADNRWDRKAAVLARMRRIGPEVRVAARNQLDMEGAFLVEQIRPAVPKDHGDLAASVEWHRNRRGDKIGIVITEGRGQEGDPNNRKAHAVEFGRPDMEAQPHFFPVYRAFRGVMRRRLNKAVKVAIGKIWGTGK